MVGVKKKEVVSALCEGETWLLVISGRGESCGLCEGETCQVVLSGREKGSGLCDMSGGEEERCGL